VGQSGRFSCRTVALVNFRYGVTVAVTRSANTRRVRRLAEQTYHGRDLVLRVCGSSLRRWSRCHEPPAGAGVCDAGGHSPLTDRSLNLSSPAPSLPRLPYQENESAYRVRRATPCDPMEAVAAHSTRPGKTTAHATADRIHPGRTDGRNACRATIRPVSPRGNDNHRSMQRSAPGSDLPRLGRWVRAHPS
jgi:hypothetical protein